MSLNRPWTVSCKYDIYMFIYISDCGHPGDNRPIDILKSPKLMFDKTIIFIKNNKKAEAFRLFSANIQDGRSPKSFCFFIIFNKFGFIKY